MGEFTRPKSAEDLEHSFGQIKPYMNATMAHYESSRCLFCYDAPCIKACPTEIDIPLFIRQIHYGDVDGAAKTIYDSNYFGNICGKVCPTKVLCEGACVYNHQEVKPIEIGRLQSFATAQAVKKQKVLYQPGESNGKKIAIIGAGPAGISCACDLRLLGYEVDIFEAKDHPSGLAIYGCAPYKVTNTDILNEVDYLQQQFQFKIHYQHPIQSSAAFKELETNYDAIFLGVGLGNTRSLQIEGESLDNCIGATEFIEQVKINPLNVKVGHRVVVIGGGNTAMDAASEAARLGASEVFLVYRRSKQAMGAYSFEYELAKAAGVHGLFNVNPIKILGDSVVTGIRLAKTQESNGSLEVLPNSEFDLAADMVIKATGQSKLKSLFQLIDNLTFDASGKIEVNSKTFQTSSPKYFAAGDAVNGGKEVVNAVGEAKVAAKGIHQFLNGL